MSLWGQKIVDGPPTPICDDSSYYQIIGHTVVDAYGDPHAFFDAKKKVWIACESREEYAVLTMRY